MPVGVLNSKMSRGINSLDGPHINPKTGQEYDPAFVDAFDSMQDVMEKEFDTDAHFVCYSVVGEDVWPRINKPALSSIRRAGSDVVLKHIVMDWDTPKELGSNDKVPLNSELFEMFAEMIMGHQDSLVSKWKHAYTTRNGGRIIYELDIPVPADESEGYINSMLVKWKELGIEMDMKCKDWTRLFRAPQVVRDGEKSNEDPFFFVETTDNLLRVADLGKIHMPFIPRVPEWEETGMPNSEDVLEIMHPMGEGGKRINSPFHLRAKRVLKNTPTHKCIFGGRDMAEVGGRNSAIQEHLGYVMLPLMRAFNDLTPQHVFALFYDAVMAFDHLPGEDWLGELWVSIRHYWCRDSARVNAERKVREAGIIESKSTIETVIKGMRKWCKAPQLYSEDKDLVEEFVRGHSIASYRGFYYLIGPDGNYEPSPWSKDDMFSRINDRHLKHILKVAYENGDGKEMMMSDKEITNKFATPVFSVVTLPQLETNGGIEDMDGEKPKLYISMYRRNPKLEPEFNKYVDEWLQNLAGKDYEQLCEWIGHALAFEDGPIAALSITAEPGVGKKLLIEGLKECLEEPIAASDSEICGRFNGRMAKSPFGVVNEAWPAEAKGVADIFKRLTGGDSITVEEKGLPQYDVVNPMRLIFMANDHEIVNSLTQGKSLTPSSRRAVGERLLHFNLENGGVGGREYIRRKGGLSFTSAAGHRWIRTDSGGTSDYIVAKHFLWLHSVRPEVEPGSRFLVAGNQVELSGQMLSMAVQHPATAVVINAVLSMLEAGRGKGVSLFVTEAYKVYVTVDGLVQEAKQFLDEHLTHRSADMALRNIKATDTVAKWEGSPKEWHEVNLASILRYASQMGITADTTNNIFENQRRIALDKQVGQ